MSIIGNYLSDDPSSDTTSPASTEHVELRSNGQRLHGVLHLPGGEGLHPTVLLLHGFPGWERNFDVAQALRRAGFASLVFHYRGCWGMPGTWSWRHCLEDTGAVLDLLLTDAETVHASLDPTRVAVVGHSLGGFLALTAAASRSAVGATVSVAGFDFGAVAAALRLEPAARPRYVEAFESETSVLAGTDGEALTREMEDAGDVWSLSALGPSFRDRPVLLVGTTLDTVAPAAMHHDPVAAAFRREHVALSEKHMATDHSLSDHRVALTRSITEFLLARL